MQCKSLWIKASAKCINVNVNVNVSQKSANCFLEGCEDSHMQTVCVLLQDNNHTFVL